MASVYLAKISDHHHFVDILVGLNIRAVDVDTVLTVGNLRLVLDILRLKFGGIRVLRVQFFADGFGIHYVIAVEGLGVLADSTDHIVLDILQTEFALGSHDLKVSIVSD